MRIYLFVAAMVTVVTGSAFAGGTFTLKQTTYEHSAGTTSLKVLEPDGFKAIVTMSDGSEKTGTIPEVFSLPEADAFLKLTVIAPDGTTWSSKIEIRARKVAVVALGYQQDGAEPAKARSYIGKVINMSQGCGSKYHGAIKAELLRSSDGELVQAFQLNPRYEQQATLPGGKYDVRVSVLVSENNWQFVLTSKGQAVSDDGWKLAFGCASGSGQPVVTSNP